MLVLMLALYAQAYIPTFDHWGWKLPLHIWRSWYEMRSCASSFLGRWTCW